MARSIRDGRRWRRWPLWLPALLDSSDGGYLLEVLLAGR
jgi:hypothetical protein